MIEAEYRVLAGLMADESAIEKVIDLIQPNYFVSKDGQTVYKAIIESYTNGEPFDVLALSSKLGEDKWLSKLGDISKTGFTSNNIEHFAEIVRDESFKRELFATMNKAQSFLKTGSYHDMLELLSSKITEIENNATATNKPREIPEIVHSIVNDIQMRHDLNGQLLGLPTGLTDLDELLNGLQKSKLYIVAGRPGMGKTILAENIATHNALNGNNTVFFSLEMSGEELGYRSLASVSGCNFDMIQRASILDNDAEFTKFSNAMMRLKECDTYHIDDTGGLGITELRARAMAIHRKKPLKLVVVDYLQLLTAKSENRFQEVSFISRELKRLAKDLDCAVIAVSQLSRKVEERSNKRPVMADLRESGQIEQDADFIAFVYREEVYDKLTPAKGLAEIITGKNRGGPIKDVLAVFQGEHQRFVNAGAEEWKNVHAAKEKTESARKPKSFAEQSAFGRPNDGAPI